MGGNLPARHTGLSVIACYLPLLRLFLRERLHLLPHICKYFITIINYIFKKLLYPICILHSSFIEEIKSNVTTYFSLLAFICKEGLFRYSTISHPFLIKYLSNSYKVSSDVYSVVIGKILARKDFAIIALLFANATFLTK